MTQANDPEQEEQFVNAQILKEQQLQQQQDDEEEKDYQVQDDGQEIMDPNAFIEDDGGDSPDKLEQQEYEAMLAQQRKPSFPGAEPHEGLEQEENEVEEYDQHDENRFTDEEIQNLKEIFDLFDKEQAGYIEVKDLETIMGSLQRDPLEVREFVENIDPNSSGRITFDEFLKLMQEVENKIVKSGGPGQQQQDQHNFTGQQMNANSGMHLPTSDHMHRDHSNRGMINVTADSKVLDFLRLLEEYRRKCEEQGNYAEARKSRSKFDELLKKETQRQRNNIRAAQEQELQNIEAAQKAQFLEFSQAWDNYMSDYEATAYLSLEKLKEKHMLEFQQFQDKIRRELRAKMKFSKDLLELRDKEAKLVRMKRYEEAEKVKMKADLLEEFERNKLEAEMQAVVQKKEAKLRHQQQLALAALLKRIQRDRNEQLKHRQQDSQRLIQRNKNILNDLLNKQNAETKRTLENLKQTLGMTKLDKLYEPQAANHPKRATMLPPGSSQSKRRPQAH